MTRPYRKPGISSEKCFEISALACGKTTNPPPGSFHFNGEPQTFTGHWGPMMGGSESVSGSIGFGASGNPPEASSSYHYSGLCENWITYTS